MLHDEEYGMRTHKGFMGSILLGVVVAAAGWSCAPLPGQEGFGGHPGRGRFIGKLETSGPNVFVDSRRAKYGESIYEGTTVTTGKQSSAKIRYPDGGFSQLDENTDPWFGIRVDEATGQECVYIRVEIGQVFIDKNLHCFETPDVAAVLNSQANVMVARGRTQLVVFRGAARVQHPPGIMAGPGEEVLFSRGVLVGGPRLMRPEEIRAVSLWRHRYDFRPPEPSEPRMELEWSPFIIFPRRDVRPRRDTPGESPGTDRKPSEGSRGGQEQPRETPSAPVERDWQRLRLTPDTERLTPTPQPPELR